MSEANMHVRFTADHTHIFPEALGAIDYSKDWEGSVKREVGEAAIKAGKAVEIGAPAREKPAKD